MAYKNHWHMTPRKPYISLLLLSTAIALSVVAAYYSVSGLCAIFAAAPLAVAIMGSVLEFAKVILASWLYRYWTRTSMLLRSYFVFALVVLLALNAIGVYGYLSKGHADQSLVSGDVLAKVQLIDEQINTERTTLDDARTTLRQLDTTVNETIARGTDENSVGRAASMRKSQAKERAALTATIAASTAKIAKLNEEKAPIAASVRAVEAEVGPLKYIAALVYGETDSTVLEKAVRLVIIMIVLVLDPVAVLMFIAYQQTLRLEENEVTPASTEWPSDWVGQPEVTPDWDPRVELGEVEEPAQPDLFAETVYVDTPADTAKEPVYTPRISNRERNKARRKKHVKSVEETVVEPVDTVELVDEITIEQPVLDPEALAKQIDSNKVSTRYKPHRIVLGRKR